MLQGASGSQMKGRGRRVTLFSVGWVRSKASPRLEAWKATPAADLSQRLQQLSRLTAEQKSSVPCHFGGAYSLECAAWVRLGGGGGGRGGRGRTGMLEWRWSCAAGMCHTRSRAMSQKMSDILLLFVYTIWTRQINCQPNVLQNNSGFFMLLLLVWSSKRVAYYLDYKVCWHLLRPPSAVENRVAQQHIDAPLAKNLRPKRHSCHVCSN